MQAIKISPQLKCFVIGPLAVLTVFFSLVNSSDYDLFAPETGVAGLALLALGTILGLIIVVGTRYVRSAIYAFLVAVTSNALFRPFPTFDWLQAGEWIYPFLIFSLGLVVFSVLRSKSDDLLSFVFFALFVSAFFIPPRPTSWQWEDTASAPERNTSLPPYIHIVLDGHIGIEGVPDELDPNLDLRDFLRNEYRDLGFKVYGRVAVPVDYTVQSFSNFLSFANTQGGEPGYVTTAREQNFLHSENRLFSLLDDKGYFIHAIQSTHLNLCRDSSDRFLVNSCQTYPFSPFMDNLIGSPLGTADKATVMFNIVFRRSGIAAIFDRIADSGIGESIGFPRWPIYVCLYCISSQTILENFEASINNIRYGDAYFIHVLAPHDPYQFYDDDCAMIFPLKFQASSANNNFARYSGQVRCTQQLVLNIIRRLAEHKATSRAIVVVHGDHGPPAYSLNVPGGPVDRNSLALGQAAYSTFFAAKAPGLIPKYDDSQQDLATLLGDVVKSQVSQLGY